MVTLASTPDSLDLELDDVGPAVGRGTIAVASRPDGGDVISVRPFSDEALPIEVLHVAHLDETGAGQILQRPDCRIELLVRRGLLAIRWVPSKPEVDEYPDECDVVGEPVDQQLGLATGERGRHDFSVPDSVSPRAVVGSHTKALLGTTSGSRGASETLVRVCWWRVAQQQANQPARERYR